MTLLRDKEGWLAAAGGGGGGRAPYAEEEDEEEAIGEGVSVSVWRDARAEEARSSSDDNLAS
jgi:hypothetical protein